MLELGFMQNAFAATGIVAVLAGFVGWFLILRREAFAGHALAHVGFTGATGAVLIGIPPLAGLMGATLCGGVTMGLMGRSIAQRDVAIGMVLSVALGLGLLFLHFYTQFASQATALLFGNVLGVDADTVVVLAGVAVASLLCLALLSRRLVFAALHPELSAAHGVSARALSVAFLAIVALATASCAQIVGVLLVFTLMVGPAASAQRLSSRLMTGLLLAPLIGVAEAWTGLVLAYYSNWPTSFWIASLSGGGFAAASLKRRA